MPTTSADTLSIGEPPTPFAPRDRAEAIVSKLTRAEKFGLVTSYFPYLSPKRTEFDMILGSGYTPGVPRAAVQALRITDASMGVSNVLNMREGDTSTALPCALAMAASFDTVLVRRAGAMIGAEARAKTFNVMLAGGINLIRDPWAGRTFEYFSEDALLSGLLGAAAVAGVQSNHIASTLKHYVLNSQETGRMIADARIDMPALRESDLLAFEIAIEGGRPASIMTAYNKVNGTWAGEHGPLINDVLKGEWGFSGWVMSDWGAVHSTVDAALAGLDQESGVELDLRLNGAVFFTDALERAVLDGQVPESRVDDMATRVLTGMIACGAHDDPAPETELPVDAEAHALVAQAVAEAGIVLLRNESAVLPLARSIPTIAVIGGHADLGVPSGGGSSQVRSNGGAPIEKTLEEGDAAWFCRMTYHASSPLAAIRAAVPDAQVVYRSGDDVEEALAAARDADVVIVFAVQWRTEAMDLETLALPDGQDELITSLAGVNAKVVVVLETGGAVLMPWIGRVAAVLQAWYSGQRGGDAIARVLFGDVAPSGRLPITFPSADADMPRPVVPGRDQRLERDAAKAAGDGDARIQAFSIAYSEGANIGYRWHEVNGIAPLFPFGFGLSYTEFDYSELVVSAAEMPIVALTLRNVGSRAGVDVPQVYVRAKDAGGSKTWRLAGFARVELQPGEVRRIEIPLEPRAFSRWDEKLGGWRQDGELRLAIGRSATDLVLQSAVIDL